jgi:predicted ATPase
MRMKMIRKVRAINFKSFEAMDVDLADLSVVIGQNSAGKSNFVSIFQFIRDISTVGLSNAISLQGGLEYLLNFKNSHEGHLEIEIYSDNKQNVYIGGSRGIKLSGASYKLQIYPFKKKKGIQRYVEEVTINSYDPKNVAKETSEIKIISENGKLKTKGDNEEIIEKVFPFEALFEDQHKKEIGSLIRFPPFSFFFGVGSESGIQVYDFDPKLSKRAIPMTGKAELESDGSNTALVLRKMLSNSEERKRFIDYVKVCLPFVKDVSVENQVDKSVLFKMSETYNSKTDIPAPIISDGTVEIVSIIYALFFEHNRLIVIEEPERNIHPHLISNLMNLIQEASHKKQIIITTHSPEIIKHLANLENLYIIDRDKNGASKVSRGSNRKEIEAFLKEKIGIEELFIDGILN